MEKQTEKQVHGFKILNLSNKTDELRRIKGLVPKKKVEWFDYKLKKELNWNIIKTDAVKTASKNRI